MSFVGLHIHSDYSLLDGASQLPQLIDKAVELGMPAIALTDHGVMYGAIQLIKLCRNKGIKAIIGNEMYVINGDITKQQRGKKFHQVVLAKNTQGYKNLVKLTTLSHLHGFQGKGIFARPCINKELLEKYHEGLIVTSGCLAGEVPQNIMQGKYEEAKKVAKWYKDLFGEDYYLEIQDHGFQEDRVVNTGIVKIADKLKIKIVATNDSHFISCRDVEAHDALLCINTQKLISEQKRMRYSGTEYLKSAEEMKQLFRDHLENDVIEEAIANTLEVEKKVEKYEGILGEPRIPDYPIPPDHNADTYLEELAWEGLLERLKRQKRSEISPVYKERMETELKVLQDKGFSTYFLVVWDYIKYARDKNIPVGPGRGSAAGSLVAYSLRITNIDPVHHGLLFERFLNPERKSMPDIDTDFCIEKRDEMIDYVTKRYGEERVAQIITFNRMTSKAVLKDVGRVLGVSFGEANKMAKLIPVARGKPAKLKVMISDETPSPEFKEAYDNLEAKTEENEGGKVNAISVRQWIDMAIRIEGTNKTFGVHAAGVVISKEPLDEIVPLQRNNDGSVITQYHMEDIESLGLLKMDFLGLKNLTIIQNTADLIEKNHNLPFPLIPDDLPALERKAIITKQSRGEMPEDVEETYKLIKSGDLEGVFQLESSGMVDVVKKLKPTSIEDISSILALYRPGPLDAGLIPKFIDRKHGREKIEYQDPKLEPILQETYGVLCLSKGTLIDKPDGSTKTIENIKTGEVILTSDGSNTWAARVAKQWKSGTKEILKITLSTGKVIYAGKNHRFLTPEGDKFAFELKPAPQSLKNAHIYSSAVYEKWPVSSNSKELKQNEAYLLGLLVGDGNLVSSTPNIACLTENAAIWVANLIQKTWGGTAKYYFHTRCWYAYSKFKTQPKPTPLTEFMKQVYNGKNWKVKSIHKRLPEDILDYKEQDRIDLLHGLWDSDGCYGERNVYYRSSSSELLREIGQLLGSLKISSYIKENYVGVIDKTRFSSIIGYPKIPDKKYTEIKENYLPVLAAKLAENLEKSIKETDYYTRKTVKRSLQKAVLFRPTDSNYKTKLENWDEFYRQIYEKTYLQDVRLVYVVSVEEAGKAECFDLEMEDQNSPYFLAEGVVVHNCYQEQIMKMAQDLAGYSLGEADLLRRAMGKKKVSEMEKHREIFIDGATQRGVPSAVAQDLFEQMIKFAEYCFNKSHSTAYAYVAYQTAYLKANYPVEYMAALLTANSGDQDKVQKYIANCQKFDIEVEPPNINKSEVDFTPLPKVATGDTQNKILFGLSAVKNVGEGAIEAILEARKESGEFKSLADLCDRVNLNALNSRTLESLIKCGAFDKIEANRHQLIKDLEGVMKWAQDRNKDRDIGQLNLFDVAETTMPAFDSAPKSSSVSDFPAKEKLQYEKEILGFYVSDHPLKYAHEQNQIKDVITIAQMSEKKSKSAIKLVVMLAGIKHHITKKGDPMAFLQVEDMTGQVDAVVFPKIYEEIKKLLTENALLVLSGKVDNKDDESQLLVDSAEALEKVMADAVEQHKKAETELDNYQNESTDEGRKNYQYIAEVEKTVEQLESQKKSPKKDVNSRDKEITINQPIAEEEKPLEQLDNQKKSPKKDVNSRDKEITINQPIA
ncbi:DNA polymerase III subunit alpha, partial [Dapis sp. BLCC M172]|uniref:DNA polymerase III subunit alpha n=1 Tax=Dapis sp. BLCC M172 TaxID=2975281 RepID=UPI003CF63A9C